MWIILDPGGVPFSAEPLAAEDGLERLVTTRTTLEFPGYGRPAVRRQQVLDVPTMHEHESLSPRIRARGLEEGVQLAGLRQSAGLRANAKRGEDHANSTQQVSLSTKCGSGADTRI
jgi:hypothetical protein